jgi:hypothetical protein
MSTLYWLRFALSLAAVTVALLLVWWSASEDL